MIPLPGPGRDLDVADSHGRDVASGSSRQEEVTVRLEVAEKLLGAAQRGDIAPEVVIPAVMRLLTRASVYLHGGEL